MSHDYSKFEDKPGHNLLASISVVAKEQLEAERAVELAQEQLEKAQAALKEIAERKLPELMAEAKQTQCTTSDGIVVTVIEKIRGSIPDATKDEAFSWLAEHNHDNLIKREFKIEFGKDEESWAKKFQKDLAQRKKPLKVQVKRAIHPSTLASFLSEQLEAGENVPLKIFGCYQQRISKLQVK